MYVFFVSGVSSKLNGPYLIPSTVNLLVIQKEENIQKKQQIL